MTSAEDVMEELPTPVRAVLLPAEVAESRPRNLLLEEGLNPTAKKPYEPLSGEQSRPMGDLVETSGLNSSDVLATLFDLEMRGIVRRLTGKQFRKVLL